MTFRSDSEILEGYLNTNTNWTLGCPALPGPSYLEALEKWKVKKVIILRKMVKDLQELEAESNEVATLVKSIVAREIAVAKWQAHCGTFPIWQGILSRAKNLALKNMTGKSALNQISEGLLGTNQKKDRAGAIPKPTFGFSDSTTRPRGRTSGTRSHDAVKRSGGSGVGDSRSQGFLPGVA